MHKKYFISIAIALVFSLMLLNFNNVNAEEWNNVFETEEEVSLDKTWEIQFNREFSEDEIEEVRIVETGNPIDIKEDFNEADGVIEVKPEDTYIEGKDYSLEVVLSNGNRYKQPFTTIEYSEDETKNYKLKHESAYDMPEFVSMQEGELELDFENENMIYTLHVENLPKELPFNQEGISIDDLEYAWEVNIYVDDDYGYSLTTSHYKLEDQTVYSSLDEEVQNDVWQIENGGTVYDGAELSVDYDNNLLKLESKMPEEITKESIDRIEAHTFHRDSDDQIYNEAINMEKATE